MLEPCGIKRAPRRDVCIDMEIKVQVLIVGQRSHERFYFIEHGGQVLCLSPDIDFPCLKCGNIQNIVQDMEQVFGRRVDGLNVIGLFWIEPRRFEQVEHAQNTIEGRAQLMAHIG